MGFSVHWKNVLMSDGMSDESVRLRFLPLLALAILSVSSLTAAPAITGIYNAAGWVPRGLPNSGVAQGALFTVTGTGLGPTPLQQAQTYPLPSTQGLAGTTIKVTVGAVVETCIMVYTSAAQAAAILPSATPVGAGTLTLSYQGASNSFAIQILAGGFDTFTLNEGGTGPGVVTDTSYNVITMINAAHPGDTLILWGTGLGAVTGDETEPPQEVDLGTGVQVFVENQPATVLYGGRSSSPGLDQIDFVVPAGISGGCKTSIAVLVKGVTGNVTSFSVAPAGQTTCGDTFGALTASNLQKAIANGALGIGFVELSRIAGGNDLLTSGFGSFSLNNLIRSYGGSFGPSIGSCLVYEISGTSLIILDPIQASVLDTGPNLVVNGPGGTKTIAATSTGFYPATLATEPSTYIQPGAYSVSNGAGGSNVGPFNWSLTLPNNVVPTNIPASINRAKDLTLTWTGSSGFSLVTILGISGVPVALPVSSYVEFICTADASTGSFTVPSAILNLLPPNGFGTTTKAGVDIQIAGIPLERFSVAGSPGLDVGVFSAFVTNGAVATLQ